MSTDLSPFDFHGQQVRTAGLNGAPAVVLTDIAKVLGYRDAANAARLLRDHHKGYSEVRTPGGTQQMLVVTEQGFNRLVMRSNAANAEEVQDWVTDEVLPSIRRTGGYVAPVQDLDELEVAERYLAALREKKALAAQVAALEGPAAQAATFREADGLRTIGDLANDLKVHAATNYPGVKVLQSEVFNLAGRVGLIIRGNTVRNNQPTARAIEAGWVRPKEAIYETDNHGTQTKVSTRLTPRGYGRLWDAAIERLKAGSLTPKEVAA